METKEGIGFINDLEIYIHDDYPEFREYKEAFIKLLQQGEKYRQIVEEIKMTIKKPYYIYTNCRGKEFHYYTYGNMDELLDKLEQKYFPKEANPTETGKAKDNRE